MPTQDLPKWKQELFKQRLEGEPEYRPGEFESDFDKYLQQQLYYYLYQKMDIMQEKNRLLFSFSFLYLLIFKVRNLLLNPSFELVINNCTIFSINNNLVFKMIPKLIAQLSVISNIRYNFSSSKLIIFKF